MKMDQPTADRASLNHWNGPSLSQRVREAMRNLRRMIQGALFRASMALAEDGNIVQHAKAELAFAGYKLDDPEEGPNKWMAAGLLDLMRVFSMQGHSGFSAPHCVAMFEKLASYKSLGPLTGADSEWFDHGDGMFQNKRDGRVFKQPDRFDGQAYFLDGRVFRDPDGCCYTNRDSMTPITFPCTPTTIYVDVPTRD
jgi:hypothetical protein